MDKQHILDVARVFDNYFLDSRAYYLYCYGKVPCVIWISGVNGERVLEYLKSEYAETITGIYQNSKYERSKKKTLYQRTILLMRDNCMVELLGDYCEILHTHEDYVTADTLIKEISRFKRREKKKDFEINLVAKTEDGLDLKPVEIKKTRLDLNLYYGDDFAEVDRTIVSRLTKKDDKGIVLLHGLPGTGKTTYLRYLVGRLKKRVLFLSPSLANNIMNPDFMDLLIENPNSVVIIEDAENIIMDRRVSSDSSVSNLLNISDGILSDFLRVQLICTFNHPLSMVDSALMRKGRLIAKYEFGKLSIAKAQRLSDHLGLTTIIEKPVTIAEITNQGEPEHRSERVEVVGFRRHSVMNN